MKSLIDEIKDTDRREDEILTTEHIARRESLEVGVITTIKMEETSWRQKARVWWIVEGGRTIRFFHCLANQHGRNYYVESLEVGDKVVVGNDQLRRLRITFASFIRKSLVGD